MRRSFRGGLFLVGFVAACFSAAQGLPQTGNSSAAAPTKLNPAAPLPSAAELKQRVVENLKKSQAEQERYVCRTTRENDITDKNGNLRKRQVRQYDMFFVNGQEIDELTARDGKPLNADQQKKEADRIQEKIKQDSDMKYVAKKNTENERQIDMLLRMLRFTNGRRIDLQGRPTLVYEMSGDPNVHPKGTEETFLHDMSGTIQVDESTGELVDLNARLDHDVKLGAGLLANLHKGLWIHVRQHRYPDGVWLPELVEGNGDARAALFFHPYFKFAETMNGCALTNVKTSEALIRH
jgi:hypothetical protein